MQSADEAASFPLSELLALSAPHLQILQYKCCPNVKCKTHKGQTLLWKMLDIISAALTDSMHILPIYVLPRGHKCCQNSQVKLQQNGSKVSSA